MFVLAGLGNPGRSHAGNRHNAGFMLLDRIASVHDFTPMKVKMRAEAETAEGRIGTLRILLIKPMDYMNCSGAALRGVLDFYKLGTDALTVAHDEIDLAAGKIRIKRGGGHGGHNGLRDIHRHVGADYRRIRIGVGRGEHAADSHVLSDFTEAEHDGWLDDLLDCMAREIGLLFTGEDNDFMTTIARLCPPPDSAEDSHGV